MNEHDTILLVVTGCYEPVFAVENVSIKNDQHPVIQWSADTSSYPAYLFDHWKILRRNAGSTLYTEIAQVQNLNKRQFQDTQVNPFMVDAMSYEYSVQIQLNDEVYEASKDGISILLENANGPGIPFLNSSQMQLTWNHHNSWATPQYFVIYQRSTPMGNWTTEWVHGNLNSPANPTVDSVYTMVNSLSPGEYRVCVRSTNPVDTQYTAYSNCLPFSVGKPSLSSNLVIPNLITPNGDQVNDGFIIQNIEKWDTQSSVKIFDRLGNLVWESQHLYDNNNPWQGTNQLGEPLQEGTYFYTIELMDADSNERTVKRGVVHITRAL